MTHYETLGIPPSLLSAYIGKLKSHDWNFEFADDSKTWRSGKKSLALLKATQASLDPTGEIWNQHAPADHKIAPSPQP